jgi:high affinity Mn2+ porin
MRRFCGVWAVSLILPALAAQSDEPEVWAVHGQATYVEQDTTGFHAPYSGPNSLLPSRGAETIDATLYLGIRPWTGAELWVNPELDQGFGLDNTLGAAGFPSGEAYKIGKDSPYFRLQRIFLRQSWNLSGEMLGTDAGINQLAGEHRANRVVLTVGKFSVGDIFDTNQYAHDPRMDFLNWTAIDTGTFDYAADAWGYTAGAALEWYQAAWTLRAAVFDLSNVPNSAHLDPGLHEFQTVVEVERRLNVLSRHGKVMFTVYNSRGRMGLLDTATARAEATDSLPDVATVRQYRGRWGAAFSAEQQLTDSLGLFARIGKSQGNVETYEFTDVDRSLALGMSVQGAAWRRQQDTVGLVGINNNASGARERYLAAGGLGILVGDGRLSHPAPEQIMEAYYSIGLYEFLHISADYQYIEHPAFNADRGPVSVFAVRVHAQF